MGKQRRKLATVSRGPRGGYTVYRPGTAMPSLNHTISQKGTLENTEYGLLQSPYIGELIDCVNFGCGKLIPEAINFKPFLLDREPCA